jgi:plastocyanin
MPDPRPTRSASPRRRRLAAHLTLLGALGAVALLSFGAVSGLAADKTIEATGNSLATYAWAPTTATISAGGTVEFKNTNAAVPHGVAFEAPPSAPSCTGVPGIGGATSWSGTCTFSQAGTYNFHCTVHPTTMTGSITVTGGGPTAPVVTTEPASSVTGSEATLNGKVNPSGQATA